MFAAVMDVLAVRKYAKAKLDIKNVLIKPFVASLIMGVIVFAAYKAHLHGGRKLPGTYVHSNSDRCSGIRIHRTENKDDNT